ncbi:hypothetical protein METP3_01328 [Methanosarcinales archaeon]|nr:hypothetical protein METP3_01328 [Methanosarcinales archaeon]
MGITNTNMEKEKAELIKKIYELGFEVGVKSHSEIGWVLREYNTLVENARKVGIRSPESYYQDGKIKGKASRDKNSEVKEKNTGIVKNVTVSEIKNDTGEIEEFEVLELHRKPGLNELPNLVKQTGHTEVPGLFDGFKPLRSSIFGHRTKS